MKLISTLLFLLLFTPEQAFAGDYERFPMLDYAFVHLDAELEVNPEQRSIDGHVRYTLNARNSMAGKLRLMAEGLDIKSVLIEGEEADFEYENGRIEISVPERFIETGREFQLEIKYRAEKPAALLKTAAGTVLTTLAPQRRPEWIPVYEHPRVEMTTRIALITPENHEAVANGYFDSSSVGSNGKRKTVWKSDTPVPSTGLGFFTGRLVHQESLLGTKAIRVYAERGVISESRHQELLRTTMRHLGDVQRRLRFEYPYDGFSLVLLADHLWEPKTYAATLGLIGLNSNGTEEQLRRIVAAQWFGSWHRSETLSDAESQLLLQAAVLSGGNQKSEQVSLFDFPDTPEFTAHDLFRPDRFYGWEESLNQMPGFQRDVITGNLQQLIRLERKVNSWTDYMNIWYAQTGRPVEQTGPATRDESPDEDEPKRVNLVFEEAENGNILVIADPASDLGRDSIKVQLLIFGRQGEPSEKAITFYRTGGEREVELDRTPANIAVKQKVHEGLEFFEMKPVDMWLHQLRNDPEAERRAEAARQMPRFREDPDIQLAMQDFLRREESSKVRTAMIRSLSDIVEGASGTQQIFIDMSREATGEELQATMDALWHYQGNSAAISAVGRVIQQSESISAAVTAAGVFRRIAGEEQFREMARSVLLSSRPPAVRAAIVEELFRAGDEELAAGTSMEILFETSFPYAVRETALRMLVRYDRDTELEEVLPVLLTDADPRIRYQALANLSALPANMMNDLLEQRYEVEKDPRVRSAFDEFY